MEISGRVIKGDGFGRQIGFPTANLDRRHFISLKRKPKLGIYAGIATLGSTSSGLRPPSPLKEKVKTYKAGIVIGPIDKTGRPKIEAHLIGYRGNLYTKRLQLQLIKYLRPFAKYTSQQALIRQIKKDIQAVKKLKL